MIARILPQDVITNLCYTKRQEIRLMENVPAEDHWKTYLETV